MGTIAVLGTLDTKGIEIQYVKEQIEKWGHKAIIVDVGILGEPFIEADFPRESVAKAGGRTLAELVEIAERGGGRIVAIKVMGNGARRIVYGLYRSGELNGVIALGGSTGTAIGTLAMEGLPVEVPKLMVTTFMDLKATSKKDIMMMQAPADILGLNTIVKKTLANAAAAITGMIETQKLMRNALIGKPTDNRKYEMELANKNALTYDGAIVSEWAYRYKYFTAHNWGKQFRGLFLDFGCGTGLASQTLENLGKQVIAFDISRSMVEIAKKRCDIPVVVADGLTLPFRDKVFSTTCIIGVLHHILNLDKAFDEICRCTKGVLCINEPSSNRSTPIRLITFGIFLVMLFRRSLMRLSGTKNSNDQGGYVSRYERDLNPRQLIQLCEDRGFKVTEIRYYNHVPLIHEFLGEKLRNRIFRALISSKKGTDVEIIAVASCTQDLS